MKRIVGLSIGALLLAISAWERRRDEAFRLDAAERRPGPD